jgi:hypothetical protein
MKKQTKKRKAKKKLQRRQWNLVQAVYQLIAQVEDQAESLHVLGLPQEKPYVNPVVWMQLANALSHQAALELDKLIKGSRSTLAVEKAVLKKAEIASAGSAGAREGLTN